MPPPLLPQTRGGKRARDDGCPCPSTGAIIAPGVCRSNAFFVEYQRRFTHEKHETALCQGTHGRQFFPYDPFPIRGESTGRSSPREPKYLDSTGIFIFYV